jgi:hypothetical protein
MSSLLQTLPELGGQDTKSWPMEVRALLGSLETEAYVERNRREASPRRRYQTQATLWFKDANNQPQPTTVYTRDVTARSLAFLTQQPLKSGQSIVLEIATGDGAQRMIQGHIRRCRQFRDGWYEGVLQIPPSKPK